MSRAGGALLSRALQQRIDMQYNALLTPVIETAIRKELRGFSNRIAVTTPSANADGFSGNAHPHGSRYLPKAQSEPQDF